MVRIDGVFVFLHFNENGSIRNNWFDELRISLNYDSLRQLTESARMTRLAVQSVDFSLYRFVRIALSLRLFDS